MPQLDINTFAYQFIGIITLFVLVYTILSYVVLPILLRFMLIRNLFLLTQQRIGDVQVSNSISQQILISRRPLHIHLLLSVIVESTTKKIKTLLGLLGNNNLWRRESQAVTSSGVHFPLFTDLALSYLILILSTDIDDNE